MNSFFQKPNISVSTSTFCEISSFHVINYSNSNLIICVMHISNFSSLTTPVNCPSNQPTFIVVTQLIVGLSSRSITHFWAKTVKKFWFFEKILERWLDEMKGRELRVAVRRRFVDEQKRWDQQTIVGLGAFCVDLKITFLLDVTVSLGCLVFRFLASLINWI